MACLAELIGAAVQRASDSAAYYEEATKEAEEVNSGDALPNSPMVLAANEEMLRAEKQSEKAQLIALEVFIILLLYSNIYIYLTPLVMYRCCAWFPC